MGDVQIGMSQADECNLNVLEEVRYDVEIPFRTGGLDGRLE